ncbi:methyl-accepting chemotaxis protein [Limosilactobacillus equigenerosi]|nr:methyl-accepting chemotaxis protein [Limosilactobacillus equigenerosi]
MNNLNSLTTEQRQRASVLMQKQQDLLANINTVNDKWGSTAKQLADQITTLNGLTDGLDATKAELTKLSDQAKAQGKTVITLQQNADGLTQAVADVKGNVSKLQQFSDEIKASLASQDGRLTDVETKAGEMTTTLSKQQTTIDKQGQTIAGQGQQINRIKLTADQATATLVDQGNSINKVQATANQLSADLQTANGDIDQLKITTNGLSNQVGRMVSDDELDKYKQAIKQYQDETKTTINGKANQAAVDDLVKRMQAQGGQITTLSSSFDQTKEALKFKADKTTVDGIKGQVDTVSAQQTIQANEIAQRVTQAMLNNSLKDVATQDFVSSQVKQWADRFNINLTSLQTKFDKQQNTSMNLVTDTPSDWVTQSGDGYQTIQTQSWEVEPGSQYTFSIEYQNFNRGQDNSTWRVEVWTGAPGPNRISPWIQTWLTTDQKGTLTGTVTAPAGTERLEISLAFGWNTGTTQRGSSINWRRLMVVKGDKPAPWTPAPADLATTKQVIDLNLDLNGVKTTVATQGQAISEFNQKASGLEGRVEDNKNNIDSLKITADGFRNQVGNMVSKDDLADTTKKISDLSTLVDQTKSAVDIKANQTDVDRLKQSVNDANAKIGVQANQILNLVTKSELTTATNGLATQNWVQTQVAQQANQWNLNITNLETRTKESLAGAGINLTPYTSDQWKKTAGNSYMVDYFRAFPVNPGETYTFSVEYRNFNHGSGTDWGIQVWTGTETGRKSPIVASKYSGGSSGKITLTVTVPANEHYLAPNLNFSNGNQTGASVEWRCFKSERGSIATPYTPAPSDIATVKSVTDLTAAVDGIKGTVQNAASKSEVAQLANALQQKVSSDQFESRISQLDNDWNVRVTDKTSGDKLMSQINLTAGRALFQSNKLVLKGETIVDGGLNADLLNAGKINTDRVTIGNGQSTLQLNASELSIKNSNNTSIYYGNGYIRTADQNGNTKHKIFMSDFVNEANVKEDMLSISTSDRLATNKKPQFKISAAGVWITPSLFFEGGNSGDNWLGFSRAASDTVYFRTYDDTKQLFEVWCQAGFKQDVHIQGNTINGWQFWSDASHDMIAFGSRMTSNFTTVQAKSFVQLSLLSEKTNILPIEEDEAISKIKAVDMLSYQYTSDVEQGKTKRYGSLIIDDVNKVKKYNAPREFLSDTGNAREDGTLVAYLTVVVQNLLRRVEKLERK